MTFTEAEYRRQRFRGIKSAGETVKSVTFEDCEFQACSFVTCRFEKCTFLDCRFDDCLLGAVVPVDSRFSGIKLTQCKAIGIDWTKARKIEDLRFDTCQVNDSNFRFLKLAGVIIANSQAKEADFTEADLSGADLRNTDFANARFFKTDLSNCDFRGARNYFIDVKNNVLKRTRFSLPEAMSLLDGLDIVIE
jgi:uncharacterized protein YjbI with pentapeptide repeats